jgi:putative aldouronate transport system permease protein
MQDVEGRPAFVKRGSFLEKVINQRILIAMSLPMVVWVLIFAYLPLTGWIMAFQDYRPQYGRFQQEWVGLENFRMFLQDQRFYEVLRNTLVMSALHIVFGFIFAIGLALVLNEVRNRAFKRSIQTISYLPHFVSWVVVASIFYTVFSTDGGVVNDALVSIGLIDEPIRWLAQPSLFWPMITLAQVWKEMGWNAIIYLAAITSIDPQLYEAARVDGLGRLGQIWHITLPGIRPTIVLLLVLAIGGLLHIQGFEPVFLLGNSLTRSHADNLAVYAYRYGIGLTRYSLSTAISIFNSIVSIALLVIANRLSARFGEGTII